MIEVYAGGWPTTRAAEQGYWEAVVDGSRLPVLCTHFVPQAREVVVTAQREAVELLEGGRAFAFPGSRRLTGDLTVGQLLGETAIDEVVMLGGTTVSSRVVLDTQDFVRPVVTGGRLVLHVRPAVGGAVVPFEQPVQTPCCADHG